MARTRAANTKAVAAQPAAQPVPQSPAPAPAPAQQKPGDGNGAGQPAANNARQPRGRRGDNWTWLIIMAAIIAVIAWWWFNSLHPLPPVDPEPPINPPMLGQARPCDPNATMCIPPDGQCLDDGTGYWRCVCEDARWGIVCELIPTFGATSYQAFAVTSIGDFRAGAMTAVNFKYTPFATSYSGAEMILWWHPSASSSLRYELVRWDVPAGMDFSTEFTAKAVTFPWVEPSDDSFFEIGYSVPHIPQTAPPPSSFRGIAWVTEAGPTICKDTCGTGQLNYCDVPCGAGFSFTDLNQCWFKTPTGPIDLIYKPDDFRCIDLYGPRVPPTSTTACVHPTQPYCRYAWQIKNFEPRLVLGLGDESCSHRCGAGGTRAWANTMMCKNLNNLSLLPSFKDKKWWCPDPPTLSCGRRTCVVPSPVTKANNGYLSGVGWTPCYNPAVQPYPGCDTVAPTGTMTLMSPGTSCHLQSILSFTYNDNSNMSTYFNCPAAVNATKPVNSISCWQWEGCSGSVPRANAFNINDYNPPQWFSFPPSGL